MPILGNLPAETVTTGYNSTGAATTLTGASSYVASTTFTNRDQLASRTLSTGTYAIARSYTWDDPTGRLTALTATQNSVALQADAMAYDVNGNITLNSHDRPSTVNDHTECFTYDGINRLTRGFTNNTVGSGANCNAPSSGGPAAYDQSYTYNEINNFATGPAGAYTYPTSGAAAVRPHAPATAGSAAFTYRPDGTMNTRTVAGTTTTYGWTAQDRLTSLTSGTNTSTMVYGPGLERILAKDSAGVHLYIGSAAERHYSAGVTTNRVNYSISGAIVGQRTRISTSSTSTVDYLLGDARSSVSINVAAGSSTTQQQWYLPYGQVRGSSVISTTPRGYVGQYQDPAGLDYLNNRFYDAGVGVFLSVDPMAASTGEPYLYAAGNPTTKSDPLGLEPGSWWDSGDVAWAYTQLRGMSNQDLQDKYESDHNLWVMLGEGNGEAGRLAHAQSAVLADRTGHARNGISPFVFTIATMTWIPQPIFKTGSMAEGLEAPSAAKQVGTLYRGDGRSTTDLFDNGMTARDPSMSLDEHLAGGNGLIGTSRSKFVADGFAVQNKGVTYVIDDLSVGVRVNYSSKFWYLSGEQEVTFTRIDPTQIRGAITPTGTWIQNPNYRAP